MKLEEKCKYCGIGIPIVTWKCIYSREGIIIYRKTKCEYCGAVSEVPEEKMEVAE